MAKTRLLECDKDLPLFIVKESKFLACVSWLCRPQFTLRSAMIFMTVVAFLLGLYCANYRNRAGLRKRSAEYYAACERKDYHHAYAMMTPAFQKKNTLEQFETSEPCGLSSQGRCISGFGSGLVYAQDIGLLEFDNGPCEHWEKIRGQWYYTGVASSRRNPYREGDFRPIPKFFRKSWEKGVNLLSILVVDCNNGSRGDRPHASVCAGT